MPPGARGLSWRKQGLSPGEHLSVVLWMKLDSGTVSPCRGSRSPDSQNEVSRVKSGLKPCFCMRSCLLWAGNHTSLSVFSFVKWQLSRLLGELL